MLPQSSCALLAEGYWFPTTFLTGVTHAQHVAEQEIFGPVTKPQIGTRGLFQAVAFLDFSVDEARFAFVADAGFD